MLKKIDAPSPVCYFQTLKNSQYNSILSVYKGFLSPTNKIAKTINFIVLVSLMLSLSFGVYKLANFLSV